jgi:hypothetical protein
MEIHGLSKGKGIRVKALCQFFYSYKWDYHSINGIITDLKLVKGHIILNLKNKHAGFVTKGWGTSNMRGSSRQREIVPAKLGDVTNEFHGNGGCPGCVKENLGYQTNHFARNIWEYEWYFDTFY